MRAPQVVRSLFTAKRFPRQSSSPGNTGSLLLICRNIGVVRMAVHFVAVVSAEVRNVFAGSRVSCRKKPDHDFELCGATARLALTQFSRSRDPTKGYPLQAFN